MMPSVNRALLFGTIAFPLVVFTSCGGEAGPRQNLRTRSFG